MMSVDIKNLDVMMEELNVEMARFKAEQDRARTTLDQANGAIYATQIAIQKLLDKKLALESSPVEPDVELEPEQPAVMD